ncbi:hypothetical protein ACL07V_37085 [Streptomyces sp. MB22_4]|uniref:hypothetical protein n=1 Tax=Streptomyces sp. MB22_4 TaxID=3383120 RepID=UPI0039A24704
MSIQIPENTSIGSAENPYNDGYTDGELAAITGLSSRRAHARAAMADQYDPLYAQGLIDGYLHAVQVNASIAQKDR